MTLADVAKRPLGIGPKANAPAGELQPRSGGEAWLVWLGLIVLVIAAAVLLFDINDIRSVRETTTSNAADGVTSTTTTSSLVDFYTSLTFIGAGLIVSGAFYWRIKKLSIEKARTSSVETLLAQDTVNKVDDEIAEKAGHLPALKRARVRQAALDKIRDERWWGPHAERIPDAEVDRAVDDAMSSVRMPRTRIHA